MDSCQDMKQAFDDVLYVTVRDTWKCLQELGLSDRKYDMQVHHAAKEAGFITHIKRVCGIYYYYYCYYYFCYYYYNYYDYYYCYHYYYEYYFFTTLIIIIVV